MLPAINITGNLRTLILIHNKQLEEQKIALQNVGAQETVGALYSQMVGILLNMSLYGVRWVMPLKLKNLGKMQLK